MCKAVEEWRQEEREEGRAKGHAEGRTEERLSAINILLSKNFDEKTIIDLGYTVNEIQSARELKQ